MSMSEVLNGYVKIEGFEDYYINKEGEVIKVYNDSRKRIISPRPSPYGYVRISMVLPDGHRVDRFQHRLLMTAFVPNLNNYPMINHKNGVKTDNRLENLEWCSNGQNLKHSREVLGNNTTSNRECLLYYRGAYVKNFNSVLEASQYASTEYGSSKVSLIKYFTSSGCAIIFKEGVTTIP